LQSDRFFTLLGEVRRSQRSYQRIGNSRLPQQASVTVRAEAAVHGIDLCWRHGAIERYELLQGASALAAGDFKQAIAEAKQKESDRRLLKSLKLLRHDPDIVMDADTFQDLPRDWGAHVMEVIDNTVKHPKSPKGALRKEARKGSLSNIAACYLVMRIEEGLRRPRPLLEIASAALSIPH
jgi:hypothetical protein